MYNKVQALEKTVNSLSHSIRSLESDVAYLQGVANHSTAPDAREKEEEDT